MITQALVRAVLGYCDSRFCRDGRPTAAVVATLTSKWSAM